MASGSPVDSSSPNLPFAHKQKPLSQGSSHALCGRADDQLSIDRLHQHSSETNLGSSPVSTLGVIADGVVRLITDPVGERAILLDHLSHLNFPVE
jgi:hypothetical protein